MTANGVDVRGRWREIAQGSCLRATHAVDVSAEPFTVPPAVFKTVCGALLRRPGWVRFPSIPATFRGRDSQGDSHSDAFPELRR